jgi:uncharacterized membrane protein
VPFATGTRLARVAFAVGIAGLGVLCLLHGDFAEQWQSVPPWFPCPRGLAYASGVILLAGGIGLLFERVAARSAFAVAAYLLLWVPVRAAGVVAHGTTIDPWYALGESVAPMIGAWTLGASLVRAGDPLRIQPLAGERATRVARFLFGAACVVFGLAHFAYADFTAGMIPRWFPARLGLAYFTGACHLAAGLAIVVSIRARLAAALEATMLGSFVLLVHVPSIVVSPPTAWAPSPQIQWTELLLAWVIAASAGIVATKAPAAGGRRAAETGSRRGAPGRRGRSRSAGRS